MGNTSADCRLDADLLAPPDAVLLNTYLEARDARKHIPMVLRKCCRPRSVPWHKDPSFHGPATVEDAASDKQLTETYSGKLPVQERSRYPPETRLLKCVPPQKTARVNSLLRGPSVAFFKCTVKNRLLIAAALIVLGASSLLVLPSQRLSSIKHRELLSFARPCLWATPAAFVLRDLLTASPLGFVLLFGTHFHPAKATFESNPRSAGPEHEPMTVGSKSSVPLAVEKGFVPTSAESSSRDQVRRDRLGKSLEEAAVSSKITQGERSVNQQTADESRSAHVLFERRDDRRDEGLASRSHQIDESPTSPSMYPHSPHQLQARQQKLLLTLDSCHIDADCFGNGRRCIEGRCWGFAGPLLRPFVCRPGGVCKLEKLKGHFYGENGGEGQGSFILRVYKGNNFSVCGRAESRGEAVTTLRKAERPALYTQVSPRNKMSRSSPDAANASVRISPVGGSSTTGQAAANPNPEELLGGEDPPVTDVRDDRCVLSEVAACASTFGSQALFIKEKRVRTECRTEQTARLAEGGHVPQLKDGSDTINEDLVTEDATSKVSLRVSHLYYCDFPSTLRPQGECDANVGVVPSNMQVGMYVVCGCSGTDLNHTGVMCASEEDFAVPVGRLLVAGFSHVFPDSYEETRKNGTRNSSTSSERDDTESVPGRRLPAGTHEHEVEDSLPGSKMMITGNHKGAILLPKESKRASQGKDGTELLNASAHGETGHSDSFATSISGAGLDLATGTDGIHSFSTESVPTLSPVYHCEIGQVCSIVGIRGVALNSGLFFVDFLLGERRTCSAEQSSENAEPALRLPCQPYAAGSLCMVSVSSADIVILLSHYYENDERQTVDTSVRGGEVPPYTDSTVNLAGLQSSPSRKSATSSTSPPTMSDSSSLPTAFSETPQGDAHRRRSLAEMLLNFGPFRTGAHASNEPLGRMLQKQRISALGTTTRTSRATAAPGSEEHAEHLRRDVRQAFHATPAGPVRSFQSADETTKHLESTATGHSSAASRFVATLCGCNSSETSTGGHRCRVPVFLGHLVLHGSISDLKDLAEAFVERRGKVAVRSFGGAALTEKQPISSTAGNAKQTRRKEEDEEDETQDEDDTEKDEEIVLRQSLASTSWKSPPVTKAVTPGSLSSDSSTASPRVVRSHSSPWRLLQYISEPATNSPSNADSTYGQNPATNECKVNTDCLSGTGVCDRGKCIGFIPDKDDSRLFRCVEGYWCDVKEGQIEGINISNKFEVIATSPSEPCGTARNLRPNESLFANSNKWVCDASSSTSCIFRAGVGHRRNKSHTVEGVRLCGCPHIDVNGDGIPCNHVRDFFVPLGRLGVQECLTNAHCIDNAFAYCIEDHCGGFLVSAAAAGVNAFTCIRNQQCTLQSIAAKSVDQALKVIPVAANFSCGAEAALDPEYVKTSALPCIADVNNDGVCDINLGVNRALGTTRLCGCSGQDLGGNGRACDEAKDFDRDLGLVSNVQCIINQDCPSSAICAKGECVEDDLEPYIVSMLPPNNTYAVPPISHIDLIFNENIKFGRPGAAILIANLQQPNNKYLIALPPNATSLKRISAPLISSGGVLPRLTGAGGGAGPGSPKDSGISPGSAKGDLLSSSSLATTGGGSTTATGGGGLFGRGHGQSHTGIVTQKLADRDGATILHNSPQHRLSTRKLGALSGTQVRTEDVMSSEDPFSTLEEYKEEEVLREDAPTGGIRPTKMRLNQSHQISEDDDVGGESASVTPQKKLVPGTTHREGAHTNNLLHSGGAKGWRRGGANSGNGLSFKKNNNSPGNSAASNSPSNNRWLVELLGQRLRITPDRDATSLPLGEYRMGIEYGFVSDLVGNYNGGENNLRFTLSKDAGCPYLYVTGFTTENGNCNGLYLPIDPMNEQASWQGGEKNAFFIYWKREPREGGRPEAQDGNWIIDTNLEDSSFLAFADLHAHAHKKQGRSRALPPSGLWHKWTGNTRAPQEHIQIHCRQQPDRFAASLIAIDPPVGAALQLSATTLLPLRPITLIFNKPMNYGHWAAIRLTPRESSTGPHGSNKSELRTTLTNSTPATSSSREVIWYSDVEAGMRDNSIRVYNKPATEVLPSFISPSPPSRPSLSPNNENNSESNNIDSSSVGAFLQPNQSVSASSSSSSSVSGTPSLSSTASSLSAAKLKAFSKEAGPSLTRALQKRLFEQRQRVTRPLRAMDNNDTSSHHTALIEATTAPEDTMSDSGAPTRGTAQTETNDIVGVVELHVQQPLLPGETYDFSVQLGAFTDLSYNPWGPVERGIIAFHTTGGRCITALSEENVVIQGQSSGDTSSRGGGREASRNFSSSKETRGEGKQQQQPVLNYAEPYIMLDLAGHPVDNNTEGSLYMRTASGSRSNREGNSTEHSGTLYSRSASSSSSNSLLSDLGAIANGEAQDGTRVRVRCRPGYSVHASARGLLKAEETILRCSDGKWHGDQQLPKCFQNCGVYPVLGSAYQMAGDVGGEGVEGEVIDVQCTNTAELLSAAGRQAIRCSGGKWDALHVKCGATCPPLGPTLGNKYEVKQLEQRQDERSNDNAITRDSSISTSYSSGSSTSSSAHNIGNRVTGPDQSNSDTSSDMRLRERDARMTRDTEIVWVAERGEAKEGGIRRISCAPGSHGVFVSPSPMYRGNRNTQRRSQIEKNRRGEFNSEDEEEISEEIQCGKEGWEPMQLQCFADCPVEQLAALLGQHGPGLEAAAGTFRDGRHGDTRDISCAVGFAPAASKFSRLLTTCSDGRWLPLSPVIEKEATKVANSSPQEVEDDTQISARNGSLPSRTVTSGTSPEAVASEMILIPRPVCVPRCAELQLPEAAYIVTPLLLSEGGERVTDHHGSLTQQQVRVRCAAGAIAIGGPGAATEQVLTCSRAGVWELLTLQCKAPCKAPLLQLGDRYEMRDEGNSLSDDRGGRGITSQPPSSNVRNEVVPGHTAEREMEEEEMYPHGTERLVGCAPGAAVDGGDISAPPQKIVCDDGLWQSAYRVTRAISRNRTQHRSGGINDSDQSPSGSKGALAPGLVDLKCRRGCEAPPLPQGVQPLLVRPRTILLQRWQHDAQLLVGCSKGYSAFLPDEGRAVTMHQRPQVPPPQEEETLVCKDGTWESLTNSRDFRHNRYYNTHPPSFVAGSRTGEDAGGGGQRGPSGQQHIVTGAVQHRQLQQQTPFQFEMTSKEENSDTGRPSSADFTSNIKGGSRNLHLTLECRRGCAAADVRRLAQQQHFEVQQQLDVSSGGEESAKNGGLTGSQKPPTPLEGDSSVISAAVAATLRHGQSLRVVCQKDFEGLSGISPEAASVIACSHGRLLMPRIVCGRPSCSDGIQNGDETGVDCGGSICSPCLPCSDGIQNNGETGIDCGGPCPPCRSCPFPPLGAVGAPPPVGVHHVIAVRAPQPPRSHVSGRSDKGGATSESSRSHRDGGNQPSDSTGSREGDSTNSDTKGDSSFDEYRSFEDTGRYVRTHFSQGSADRPLLPSGSSLHLQCEREATASGPAAAKRFAVLRCMPSGQWLWAADAAAAVSASSGSAWGAVQTIMEEPLEPHLACTPPTCFDGVRNGDETGVDCGGSCSRSCASCFNGIQDGEEEDIDCGGRDCEPCASCSPRLLKPFLLNNSTFAIVRRGAVVATSVAAAAGVSSSSIPSALLLDQELAKGTLHPLLTGHGQQLQIKCRPAASPASFAPYVSGPQIPNEEAASSSLAAASAGAYYIQQQPQQQHPHGIKQPLPLTVHCRHGVWTAPAVAAASALALTKNASATGQQAPFPSGKTPMRVQQQDSWLARAALEAYQALQDFRENCTTYIRASTAASSSMGNYALDTNESDASALPLGGLTGSTAMYNMPLPSSRGFPNPIGFPASSRRQLFWTQPQFAVFAVPDLRVKPSSTAAGVGGTSSERTGAADEPHAADGDACVSRLIETFRTSLRGECGALAFGSSSLKISSFCSNSCRQGLEAAIATATRSARPSNSLLNSNNPTSNNSHVDTCSSGEAAARVQRVAHLLQQLLDVWCKQRNGNYCFAEAEASFAFVQQLYFLIQSGTYYESELAVACPADSCFRNNIKHIVLLAHLSALVDVPQPAATAGSSSHAARDMRTSAKSVRRSPQGSPSRRLRQQEPTIDVASLLSDQDSRIKLLIEELQQPIQQRFPELEPLQSQTSSAQHSGQNRVVVGASETGSLSHASSTKTRRKTAAVDIESDTGRSISETIMAGAEPIISAADEESEEGSESSFSRSTAAVSGAEEREKKKSTKGIGPATSLNVDEVTSGGAQKQPRRLLASVGGTASETREAGWDEGGTKRFLTDLRNLPEILDLVCMRVDGHSCAPEVLRVGLENPVLHSPAADVEETQRICMRDPCVLEVVRMFGQLLIDAADASIFALPQQHQQRNNRSIQSNHRLSGSSIRAPADREKNSNQHTQQPPHRPFSTITPMGPQGDEEQGATMFSKAQQLPASLAGGGKRDMSSATAHAFSFDISATSSVQPRDVVLGTLMKYWGRTYCHRNVRGALCGGYVFPSKENAALAEESRAPYVSWSPQRERSLYQCRCPVAFVGDGDCDVSCFSPECQWDGGDCLATELVFPVYRHIITQFEKELGEPCNPFNAAFTCNATGDNHTQAASAPYEAALQQTKKRGISSTNGNCAAYFNKLAEVRGCCLATQLEVLRDLLEADVRILAATRRDTPASGSEQAFSTSSSSSLPPERRSQIPVAHADFVRLESTWPVPPRRWLGDIWLQLDRSSFFFEHACQQQLDRTCSRGLSRFAYSVEFKISNVDYDDLLAQPLPAYGSGADPVGPGAPQLSSVALTPSPRGLGRASVRVKRSLLPFNVPGPVQQPHSGAPRSLLSQDSSRSTGGKSGPTPQQEAKRRGAGQGAGYKKSDSKSSGTTSSGTSSSRRGGTNEADTHSRSQRSSRGPAGEAKEALHLQESLEILQIEDRARELLLRAEASPKLHEFKRIIREELAAIFHVPAADVIEMRVWRGSIDVHAVIDAGWLSNRRSFREHVESLTADPQSSTSLASRLSAGLTRHLAAIPSYSLTVHKWGTMPMDKAHLPLLVLALPTFPDSREGPSVHATPFLVANGDNDGREEDIYVSTDQAFIERVPLMQQLRYHPGSAVAAAVAMPPAVPPPFGTFGVSELPTESRVCVGAEELHPAEGSSIAEAYKLTYKHAPSANAGPLEASRHGHTMTVECNAGHEAIAGESPQELICNQGRWEPLSSLFHAYSRLQPTSPVVARREHKESPSSLRLPAFSSTSPAAAFLEETAKDYPSAGGSKFGSHRDSLPSSQMHAEVPLSPRVSVAMSAGTAALSSSLVAPAATEGTSSAASNSLTQHTIQEKETAAGAAAPRILVCRRPCLPYESIDPAILRAEFVISGMGSSHGDKRSVFCAPGYSSRDPEAFPTAQQMLTCVNGTWLPPRTLVCEKDFAAVSGSSSSTPCSGALSGLEERYKLTEVPLSSTVSPDISVDLGNALNARLQPKGVSLQVFRITCARGYTHQHPSNAAASPVTTSLQQQQGQQQERQSSSAGSGRDTGEVYLACLNGVLIGFGTEELFPHGGSAEGHRAGELAAAFEMRLHQHSDNTVTLARRKHGASATGSRLASASAAFPETSVLQKAEQHRSSAGNSTSAAEKEDNHERRGFEATLDPVVNAAGTKTRKLQAGDSEERYSVPRGTLKTGDIVSEEPLKKAEDEDDLREEADYVQQNLKCERDVRMDPPIEAKPISDTVMVFLCLLVLFALTVVFLAGWWIWNTKKKRKLAAVAGALTESSGEPPAPLQAKEIGNVLLNQGADADWYTASNTQYGEYHVRTATSGLDQSGGSSEFNPSEALVQKPAGTPGVPADAACEDFSGMSGGDSQRLLLSRYYWLAAAAAAAGKASAEAAAAATLEESHGDPQAGDYRCGDGTSRSNCSVVHIEKTSAQALVPASLLSQRKEHFDHTKVVSWAAKANHQRATEVNSSPVSSPNHNPSAASATAAAFVNQDTMDPNVNARSPRQAAVNQRLLHQINTQCQQHQEQEEEQRPHTRGDARGGAAAERVGTVSESHYAVPAEFEQSEGEKRVCFVEEPEDCCSELGRDSSKNSSSPIYLRGLPGGHGSVIEIHEQSVLEGKSNVDGQRLRLPSAPVSVAAGCPAHRHACVERPHQKDNDTMDSLVSCRLLQRLKPTSAYQQQQPTQQATEGLTSVSPIFQESFLTVEALEAVDSYGDLPEHLHHCAGGQLSEVEAQHSHFGQPLFSRRVLPLPGHRNITGNSPATTSSWQRHMADTGDGGTADSAKYLLEIHGKKCSLVLPSSNHHGTRQSLSRDPHRAESIVDASGKRQTTADLSALSVECRHSSISTASSLNITQAQRPRRRSTTSSCSSSSKKRGILRKSCGMLVDARELRDEHVFRGRRGNNANCNSGCNRKFSYLGEKVAASDSRRRQATNTCHPRQVQQQCTEAPTEDVSGLEAVTPASEDAVYPEDSASCVGETGYCARRAQNTGNPPGGGNVAAVTSTNYSRALHLPSQPPALEMYPSSEGQQERNERLWERRDQLR